MRQGDVRWVQFHADCNGTAQETVVDVTASWGLLSSLPPYCRGDEKTIADGVGIKFAAVSMGVLLD